MRIKALCQLLIDYLLYLRLHTDVWLTHADQDHELLHQLVLFLFPHAAEYSVHQKFSQPSQTAPCQVPHIDKPRLLFAVNFY